MIHRNKNQRFVSETLKCQEIRKNSDYFVLFKKSAIWKNPLGIFSVPKYVFDEKN